MSSLLVWQCPHRSYFDGKLQQFSTRGVQDFWSNCLINILAGKTTIPGHFADAAGTLRAAVDDGTFCRQVSSTILLVMMQRAENVHSQTFCRLVQSCVQSQRVGHAVSFLSPRSPAVQRSSRMQATSCSLTCPQRRHACADRTRCCPPVHRGAAALALLLSEATKCWPRSHRSAGRALCVFFF